MSQRLSVYAYKRGPSAHRGRTNDDPEGRFQRQVARFLDMTLPDDYLSTANGAGARISAFMANKLKAMGVRPGWPDIQIMTPYGLTLYLELKSEVGRLSDAQKRFAAVALKSGRPILKVCRTGEEIEAALIAWKIPIKCPWAALDRYAV